MEGNINLAYYRKEDWEKLVAAADDKEKLPDTWEEWHAMYSKTKIQLILQGFKVNDVEVDIEKLKKYCRKRKIKNDGKARSEFVVDQ